MPRLSRWLPALLLLVSAPVAAEAPSVPQEAELRWTRGHTCSGGTNSLSYISTGSFSGNGLGCSGLRCTKPVERGRSIEVQGACDPLSATCGLTVNVDWLFQGNRLNDLDFDPETPGGYAAMSLANPGGGSGGACGGPNPDEWLKNDLGTASFDVSLSCASAKAATPGQYTYSLTAFICPSHLI